jgi:hypothetical protein
MLKRNVLSVIGAALMLALWGCGGNSSSHDKGVVINGVKWATRNTDANGKFVSSQEEIGFSGGFYSIPDSLFPKGWRLPTEEEFASLIKASHEIIEHNGMHGRSFGTEPNNIFLPSVPVIPGGTYGLNRSYWSSTVKATSYSTYIITIWISNKYIHSESPNITGSIRLVYDETAK